jgi:hypothetical protein
MTEMDNLLGSRISLISQQDIRYDGVLFSINAKESSIVLKDGIFFFVIVKFYIFKLHIYSALLRNGGSTDREIKTSPIKR